MQIQSVFWIYQRFILTVGRLYHHLTCIRNFCLSLYRDWRMTDLDSNFYWVRVPSMCLLVISSSNSREGNGIPLQCSCLENPRDGKPGGLLSLGSHRVGHDWSNLAAAAAAACYFKLQKECMLIRRRKGRRRARNKVGRTRKYKRNTNTYLLYFYYS